VAAKVEVKVATVSRVDTLVAKAKAATRTSSRVVVTKPLTPRTDSEVFFSPISDTLSSCFPVTLGSMFKRMIAKDGGDICWSKDCQISMDSAGV
jgi:hypothetical protein